MNSKYLRYVTSNQRSQILPFSTKKGASKIQEDTAPTNLLYKRNKAEFFFCFARININTITYKKVCRFCKV